MTIVCAYKDPAGKIWIGSDTATTYGSYRMTTNGGKFVRLATEAYIGSCGLAVAYQHLRKIEADFPTKKDWDIELGKGFDFQSPRTIIHFAEWLRARFEDEGYIVTSEDDGSLPIYSGAHILCTKNTVYVLTSDFLVVEAGSFAAIGSGSAYAYGVYEGFLAATQAGASIEAHDLIMAAIHAANKYNVGCSGISEIVCVTDTLEVGGSDATRNPRQSRSRKG